MSDPRDAFVINRLRSHPVHYSIDIDHLVIDGEWRMLISVKGIDEDDENRRRLAADLRVAATWLENPRSQVCASGITEAPRDDE